MTEKQDKFSQIVSIYKKKYSDNIEGMFKFINEKVDSPTHTLQLIQTIILSYQNRQEKMTQAQLKHYLHLIAAAQANVDIRNKKIGDLEVYVNIRFKSSKKNPSEQIEQKKEVSSASSPIAKEEKVIKKQEDINQKQRTSSDRMKNQKLQVNINERIKYKQQQQINTCNKPKATNPQQTMKSSKQNSNKVNRQKHQEKQQLAVVVQNVIAQDVTTTAIKPNYTKSQQFFLQFPQAQMMKVPYGAHKKIQITGYDKFGQNYFNPIIKYRIVYEDKIVYRRYTQFQNLMNFLNIKYEGFILPELPPKEGIKYNLSYFRGIDEAFLNERQQKLQQMLNILICSTIICDEQVLRLFLTDQNYEIQSVDREGTLGYLQSLSKIAFNMKQLKIYGLAYFDYWKQFKKTDIKTKVTERYKQVESLLSYCMAIDNYRVAINNNFDRRRQIFKDLETDKDDRNLSITEFDKLSANTSMEVRNLDKEVNKYLQLKSQESWLGYLIGQKQGEKDNSLEDLKIKQKQIKGRLQKMQDNLMNSINELAQNKNLYLQSIKMPLIQWRQRIHP